MDDKIKVMLTDEEEIVEMINSGRWWVLIGNPRHIGDMETQLQVETRTVMGPPPGQFKQMFPDVRFMPITFIDKNEVNLTKMQKALTSCGAGDIPSSEKQDILLID